MREFYYQQIFVLGTLYSSDLKKNQQQHTKHGIYYHIDMSSDGHQDSGLFQLGNFLAPWGPGPDDHKAS